MKPARFSKRAQLDLEQIRNGVGADAPDAVDRFWQALLEMADLLAGNAELGNRIINAGQKHADIRWILVPPIQNYLVFYRPYLDSVLIVRIYSRGAGFDSLS